jgi:hypothetical protein
LALINYSKLQTSWENFEFGLCGYIAKDLETLESHLRTYEIYECVICDIKILQLANIKTHFMISVKWMYRHIKQSIENIDVFDQQYHSYLSLFPEI